MQKKHIKLKTKFLVSFIFGIIAFVIGFILPFMEYNNTDNSIQEINIATDKIEALFKDTKDTSHSLIDPITGRDKKTLPTWQKIADITSHLHYHNSRIAKAKALLHYNYNPIPPDNLLYSDLWDKRFIVSKEDWKIKSLKKMTYYGLLVGLIYFFSVLIAVFLLLFLIPWLWYFFLNRLGELSQAIRGTPPE